MFKWIKHVLTERITKTSVKHYEVYFNEHKRSFNMN